MGMKPKANMFLVGYVFGTYVGSFTFLSVKCFIIGDVYILNMIYIYIYIYDVKEHENYRMRKNKNPFIYAQT